MRISDWSSDVCSSDLDLPGVEAEAFVDLADLRLSGLWIGQDDAACAAIHDGRRDDGVLDVRQRLRGEDHRRDLERKRAVEGRSGSVRVDMGGRRLMKQT